MIHFYWWFQRNILRHLVPNRRWTRCHRRFELKKSMSKYNEEISHDFPLRIEIDKLKIKFLNHRWTTRFLLIHIQNRVACVVSLEKIMNFPFFYLRSNQLRFRLKYWEIVEINTIVLIPIADWKQKYRMRYIMVPFNERGVTTAAKYNSNPNANTPNRTTHAFYSTSHTVFQAKQCLNHIGEICI